jgi:CRP-like cAMP-binding protein
LSGSATAKAGIDPRSYLKAVQAVGETSLFLQEPRDVTVAATTPSHWCYLTSTDLNRFLDKYPEAVDKLAPREEVRARRGMKRLPWMEPAEQLVLRRRRHWFFMVRRMLPPLFLLLAALILAVTLLLAPLALLVGIAAVLWAGWRLVDWLNDYYVLTTMRVAHREKTLLIRETRDEAPLDKVQNVNLSQGVIGNYLGFGILVIETAAAIGVSRVRFKHVPEPAEMQQLIFQQMRRLRAGEAMESQQIIHEKLESRIDLGPRLSIPRPVIRAEEPSPPSEPPRVSVFRQAGRCHLEAALLDRALGTGPRHLAPALAQAPVDHLDAGARHGRHPWAPGPLRRLGRPCATAGALVPAGAGAGQLGLAVVELDRLGQRSIHRDQRPDHRYRTPAPGL